jgi:cell division protein ftsZ homolog 3|nr:MAG TPA: CetZ-like protein [Caudoviricetes sp.]
MLEVGIIGIGNTGNQVASLAKEKLGIPVLAINSSEKDLETVPNNIPKKLITDKDGLSSGAGKDRQLAKTYLKDSITNLLKDQEIIELISPLDVVFIVSSTGGGTGSGTAPLLANIIEARFVDTKVIMVGVLPVNSEALSAHVNTLEYLNELYKVMENQTYMLYDNDKCAGLPSYKLLDKVNNEIVEDINVLRCNYNYTTKLDSIDDRDAKRLISFAGRIVVSRVEDFKEKDTDNMTIEDMLIDNIKKNCHVEAQRDKKIMASGIITNLSQTLTEEFDNNIPKVRDFMGDPIHAFNHIYVNDDRKMPNNVYLILSGLSPINDRINIISDRIEEIEERQKTLESDDALSSVSLDTLSSKISDKEKSNESTTVDLKDIFGKFM